MAVLSHRVVEFGFRFQASGFDFVLARNVVVCVHAYVLIYIDTF